MRKPPTDSAGQRRRKGRNDAIEFQSAPILTVNLEAAVIQPIHGLHWAARFNPDAERFEPPGKGGQCPRIAARQITESLDFLAAVPGRVHSLNGCPDERGTRPLPRVAQ